MTLQTIIVRFIVLLKNIVPVIIGFAVIVFLYGLLQYMINVGNEEKRKEGVKYITWGIVGFFVMVGMWGLVYTLTSTFGFNFGIPKIY